MNPEEQLVKKAQRNIKYFAPLYDIYYPKIRRYIGKKIYGDSNTADDLTSTTFEKALKSIKSFRWQGISFSAWIYRIANNTVIDFYRSNAKKKGDALQNDIEDKNTNIESKSQQSDTTDYIKTVLNSLSERERKIIMMKFYEGMTNTEIAESLGISETNVSTIVYRTMAKLRELVDQDLL